jgi:hypothetical protein
MPKRLERCFRCKATPEHTSSVIAKGRPYHTYFCPQCGQGTAAEFHTPEGREHAALRWNNEQWKGKLKLNEMKTRAAEALATARQVRQETEDDGKKESSSN